MRFGRGGWGDRANDAVHTASQRIDGGTEEVAQRVVHLIVIAVRLLRFPTLAVLVVPLPFIVVVLLLGLNGSGVAGAIAIVAALVMAAVSGAFALRRMHVLHAVEEPAQLGSEIAIMLSLTDKVDETRGMLTQIAGGGGWRIFSRLKGVWRGAGTTGRWIGAIGDLPRAKWFGPPRIGTTITLSIAALWLIPVSMVIALFAVVAAIAGTL